MKLSGQLHVPVTLSQEKNPSNHWKGEKSAACTRRQTPNHPSFSLATILAELACFTLLIDRDHKNFNILNRSHSAFGLQNVKIFELCSLSIFQNICWHELGFQSSFTNSERGLHTHTHTHRWTVVKFIFKNKLQPGFHALCSWTA